MTAQNAESDAWYAIRPATPGGMHVRRKGARRAFALAGWLSAKWSKPYLVEVRSGQFKGASWTVDGSDVR